MLRADLETLVLQVPLPLLAPNLMEPYLRRALELIGGCSSACTRCGKYTQTKRRKKRALRRALAKTRSAAARVTNARHPVQVHVQVKCKSTERVKAGTGP